MAVTLNSTTLGSSANENSQEIATLKVRMTEQETLLAQKVTEITDLQSGLSTANARIDQEVLDRQAGDTALDELLQTFTEENEVWVVE